MIGPAAKQTDSATMTAPEADHGLRRSFVVSPSGLLVVQLKIIAALLVASTAGQVALRAVGEQPGLTLAASVLYIDGELRIPALYSTLVLACCALVLSLIGGWTARAGDGGGAGPWRLLAVVFGLLAADEFLAFHERSIDPLRQLLGITSGPLFYAWIIPGVLFVVGLGAGLIPFLWRLPVDTRLAFVASGLIFVSGAVGLEAVAATYVSSIDPDTAHRNLPYVALATVEESLEMVGAAVFLAALARHVERHLQGGSIEVALVGAHHEMVR